MGQEVAARIKNMHVHYHPLARNVFLSEHLGEVVKSSLAKSLLWSVLFKGAGTWGHIGTCWIKKIGGCTGLCFARHVRQFSLAADENCNDPDTWHGLLAQDLEQTALIMHKRVECNAAVFLQTRGMALVKRFVQRLQESCWSSQDGDIAGDGQLVHLTSDLDGAHTCTDCGKQFASNCGLAVHMARVHGVRRSAPSYAGRDGICSSCKRGVSYQAETCAPLIRVRSVWNGACCIASL